MEEVLAEGEDTGNGFYLWASKDERLCLPLEKCIAKVFLIYLCNKEFDMYYELIRQYNNNSYVFYA
jgi:hypothetical protein